MSLSEDVTGQQAAPTKAKQSGNAGTAAHRASLQVQLKKTKICVYHLRGECFYGEDCTFAHSCSELQSMPDLSKTRLCKMFSAGNCDDESCNFAHGEQEMRSTNMFYKRTLCIWNEKGKCKNFDQCRFAHGTAELRTEHKSQESSKGAGKGDGRSRRQRKGKGASAKAAEMGGSETRSTSAEGSDSRGSQSGSAASGSGLSMEGFFDPMKEPMKIPLSFTSFSPSEMAAASFFQNPPPPPPASYSAQDTFAAPWEFGAASSGPSFLATNGEEMPPLDLQQLRSRIAELSLQCGQLQQQMIPQELDMTTLSSGIGGKASGLRSKISTFELPQPAMNA